MTTLFGRFDEMVNSLLAPTMSTGDGPLRCVDLFCGIGAFHVAARELGLDVIFACDIDEEARRAYLANFGLHPHGDILSLSGSDIPDHDLLFAGFPCQPFSIIGRLEGFADPRGTLFFEALRILRAKRPRGVILENVKQLATADSGRILARIMTELEELGYAVDYRVLNALDFGLPQKRERTIIVGTQYQAPFPWPEKPVPMTPLADVLEANPSRKHYVSPAIRAKRHAKHTADFSPAIWHENKAGNVSSHTWSCAIRAGASYNYLLVDGERRLTVRELLRLQGFPDGWEIVCNDAQTRKQAGNAVPVPMVQAVIEQMVSVVERAKTARQ
jgi:DNA (cytosine-5)-methyltransferase 1